MICARRVAFHVPIQYFGTSGFWGDPQLCNSKQSNFAYTSDVAISLIISSLPCGTLPASSIASSSILQTKKNTWLGSWVKCRFFLFSTPSVSFFFIIIIYITREAFLGFFTQLNSTKLLASLTLFLHSLIQERYASLLINLILHYL